MYDEGHLRGLWRLGNIEDVIQSADGGVRGVIVKVTSRKGHVKYIRRPIQHIYPLNVRNDSPTTEVDNVPLIDSGDHEPDVEECTQPGDSHPRPVRRAAMQARDRIVGCLTED